MEIVGNIEQITASLSNLTVCLIKRDIDIYLCTFLRILLNRKHRFIKKSPLLNSEALRLFQFVTFNKRLFLHRLLD